MEKEIKLPKEMQEVLYKIDLDKAKAEIELTAFRKESSKIEASYLNRFRKLQEDFKQEIVAFLEEKDLDQEDYVVYKMEDGFYVGKKEEELPEETSEEDSSEEDPFITELLQKYLKD